MSQELILGRRAYMRQKLQGTQFENFSNDDLDNTRITDIAFRGFIVDDPKGYNMLIDDTDISPEFSKFRRDRSMVPFSNLSKKAKDFDWTIYNCDTSGPKELVNRFITKFDQFKESGYGLYIYSAQKGSGKTLLASVLLNEISERYPVSTKFLTINDYLEMTKKGYKGETEELTNVDNSKVLVLDDIGAQMDKEWVNTVLFALINTRYNKKLITVYTSNIPIAKLKMDERIIDRIDSRSYPVELPSVPIRHIKAEKEKNEFLEQINNAPK